MDEPKLPPSLSGFSGVSKLVRKGTKDDLGGYGGYGPHSNRRQVEVLKQVTTVGAPKVQTKVSWRRPSDGTDVVMICDVYGVIKPTALGEPPTVSPIYKVHAMCPKCGPTDPNGSQFEIPEEMCKIELDEQGLLWLEGGRAVV